MSDSSVPPEYRLYQYTPSLAGGVIGAIVFTILTALHVWKLQRHRTYYFVPFVIGGIFQSVGYCGRIWSHFDYNGLGGFIIQALLILLAPALYAASIYMILGRLIRSLKADRLSPVPLRWLTKIFVAGDVLSFTMQSAGGGMQSGGTLELLNAGKNIIIAGLLVQVVFFSLFVVTTIVFHRRAKQASIQSRGIPWVRHLMVLYGSSALILVRSIFRVIEYAQGNTGYLISHEVFLYVFDFLLMAAVMVVLFIWHVSGLEEQSKDMQLERV